MLPKCMKRGVEVCEKGKTVGGRGKEGTNMERGKEGGRKDWSWEWMYVREEKVGVRGREGGRGVEEGG